MGYGAKTIINTIKNSRNKSESFPFHSKKDFLFIEEMEENEFFVRFLDDEFNVYDYMLLLTKSKKEVLDYNEYFIELEDTQYFDKECFNWYKKIFKENYMMDNGTLLAPQRIRFNNDKKIKCFVDFAPYDEVDFEVYSLPDNLFDE